MFDLLEAHRSGTFVCGMTGSGKSDLSMRFADKMLEEGTVVYVMDPAQAWRKQSTVHHVITITNPKAIHIPDESTQYDISLMTILEQQEFVESFCKTLFMRRAASDHRPMTWIVFEEAQLYLPQGALRAKKFQECVRLISVGRNFNIKFCLVTPFASQVDKYALKLCGQRYFGYTTEPNDIDYLDGYLGKEDAERLKKLQPGQFFYEHRGEKELIYSEQFQAETIATELHVPTISAQFGHQQPVSNINWPVIVWALILMLVGVIFWR